MGKRKPLKPKRKTVPVEPAIVRALLSALPVEPLPGHAKGGALCNHLAEEILGDRSRPAQVKVRAALDHLIDVEGKALRHHPDGAPKGEKLQYNLCREVWLRITGRTDRLPVPTLPTRPQTFRVSNSCPATE